MSIEIERGSNFVLDWSYHTRQRRACNDHRVLESDMEGDELDKKNLWR